MHDGICRAEDTDGYRERRRKAFEGLTFGESADSIEARMRGQGLAIWEIEDAIAMVSDPDFIRSIKELDMVKRSVMVTSLEIYSILVVEVPVRVLARRRK